MTTSRVFPAENNGNFGNSGLHHTLWRILIRTNFHRQNFSTTKELQTGISSLTSPAFTTAATTLPLTTTLSEPEASCRQLKSTVPLKTSTREQKLFYNQIVSVMDEITAWQYYGQKHYGVLAKMVDCVWIYLVHSKRSIVSPALWSRCRCSHNQTILMLNFLIPNDIIKWSSAEKKSHTKQPRPDWRLSSKSPQILAFMATTNTKRRTRTRRTLLFLLFATTIFYLFHQGYKSARL